jgi:amino acid transporter
VLTVAGFYVVGAYAQVAGYGFNLDALGKNASAPLFGLAGPVADGGLGSVAIRRLLEVVVVLDMLAVLIGVSVAASRGFFALGRDHRLPKALGAVSGRGTPLVAGSGVLAAYVVVVVVTMGWTGLFAQDGMPHYVAMFSWLSTLGSFSLGVIYLLMSVGAIRGLADHPKRWAVYLAATVGIAVTAAAIFGSAYKVPAPTIYAVYAGAAVFVVGLALTYVFPGRAAVGAGFADQAAREQGHLKL